MMFARILRPPSHGAKLTSVDTSGAEQVKGTQVVREGDFIAVLNEDIDLADEALIKIKAEYTFNELNVDNKSVYDRMTGADSVANIVRTTGDLVTGSRLSDKLFESEFHDPYVAHAPIETHTALAVFEGDKLTVWAATQTPFGLQMDYARNSECPSKR
jgi:isoquinoline 1-oxidoreductase